MFHVMVTWEILRANTMDVVATVNPEDYVAATSERLVVREFVNWSVESVGIKLRVTMSF